MMLHDTLQNFRPHVFDFFEMIVTKQHMRLHDLLLVWHKPTWRVENFLWNKSFAEVM